MVQCYPIEISVGLSLAIDLASDYLFSSRRIATTAPGCTNGVVIGLICRDRGTQRASYGIPTPEISSQISNNLSWRTISRLCGFGW